MVLGTEAREYDSRTPAGVGQFAAQILRRVSREWRDLTALQTRHEFGRPSRPKLSTRQYNPRPPEPSSYRATELAAALYFIGAQPLLSFAGPVTGSLAHDSGKDRRVGGGVLTRFDVYRRNNDLTFPPPRFLRQAKQAHTPIALPAIRPLFCRAPVAVTESMGQAYIGSRIAHLGTSDHMIIREASPD